MECSFYEWRITDEIYKYDVVNKVRDGCDHKGSIGCIVCDCSYDDYIKLTYDQLLKIDKDILSKNTNLIIAFCYNLKNCKLNVECGLDCLKVKHRNCIWINFS